MAKGTKNPDLASAYLNDMRRLYADREEKRVTRGSDISGQDGEQEQLDVNDPSQRSLRYENAAVGRTRVRPLLME